MLAGKHCFLCAYTYSPKIKLSAENCWNERNPIYLLKKMQKMEK